MDYRKVYNELVDNRLANPLSKGTYGEVHHIIPTAEGGSDDASNKVKFTAREHYIAHLLLAKIYDDCAMHCAIVIMKNKTKSMKRDFHINSRLYEKLKLKRAKFMSKKMKGRKRSEEFKQHMREVMKGKNKGHIPWNKGKKTSAATRKKISESTKVAMQRPDVRERYLVGYKNRKDRQ